MSVAVLVVSERIHGEIPEVTFELLGRVRALADELHGELAIAITGEGDAPFGIADVIYSIDGLPHDGYAASALESGLVKVLQAAHPKVVLVSTGTVGIDLAGPLGVRTQAAVASYATDVRLSDGELVIVSQLYGGKLMAESIAPMPAVVAIVPGSFPADLGRQGGTPRVERIDASVEAAAAGARARGITEPETTGVDITSASLLVSVGRGIGSKDNLELVQELADALKVPLAASRPVIDQGWLPKPHQVGKSGKKVKPTVYLAFGISGAPEHLEGMRNAELIIACNTDPNAPIFEVAHYGTTVDLFDLVPELTELVGA
jgi:electron transfer flavoprotein alpha subunit